MLNEHQNQLKTNTELMKEKEQQISRWEEEITRLESELIKQVNANEQTSHSMSNLKMARSEDSAILQHLRLEQQLTIDLINSLVGVVAGYAQ